MKAQSAAQKLTWLHTWGGLVFGWILFAVFLTGTLTVFDKEISHWLQPELEDTGLTQAEAARRGLDWLAVHKPQAAVWNLWLPTERAPGLSVSAGEGRRGGDRQALDPRTGKELTPRKTEGGEFFFRFHFTLDFPYTVGMWVVGVAAMAMLAAIVSGIVIHKKFFKEFFTFRPAKGQRSWLDAHNATGVLTLPFLIMITYTGLAIFYVFYMPAGVDVLFGGDRQAAFQAMRESDQGGTGETRQGGNGAARQGGDGHAGGRPGEVPVGHAAGDMAGAAARTMLPPAHFIQQGERYFGAGGVASLSISRPGQEGATVRVSPLLGYRIALTKGESVTLDAYSGRVLTEPSGDRAAQLTARVMSGLHFAQFGGYPMRWLYFLCGMASCAMIATGLVLFCVKRRRQYAGQGPAGRAVAHLIESMNVAAVAGMALACLAFLGGSRLLPATLEGRESVEEMLFFGAWLASLLHALFRPHRAAWGEQLALAALLCLALPVLDLVWEAILFPGRRADGMRLSLDAAAAAFGLGLAWTAWKVFRAPSAARRTEHKASLAEVEAA